MGIGISNADHAAVIRFIKQIARAHGKALVNNVNVHALNISCRSQHFFRILNDSEIVFCDGFGVKAFAKIAGVNLQERMTPRHWIDKLFRDCEDEQIPLFFLGDTNEVVHRFAEEVRRRHPRILLAGYRNGFFDMHGEQNQRVIEQINQSGSGIILVGMGMPRQEIWAHKALSHLNRGVLISVGALFRVYTGMERPCPEGLSRFGFEWLWRLVHQPIRLGKRYLLGNTTFLLRACYIAIGKRLFGFLFALLSILLLMPLLIFLYVYLQLQTGGSPLFRQERVGKDGRRFWIHKFRTLKTDFPPYVSKGKITPENITRTGRILRLLALDELPQLINVIRGDMALVGPRPEMPFIADRYQGIEKLRLSVRPGLTGLWQLARLRGETAGREIHEDICYDLNYIRQMGLLLDLRILMQTLFTLAALPFHAWRKGIEQ